MDHKWEEIQLRKEENGPVKRIKETSDLYYGEDDNIRENRQKSPLLSTTNLIQPKVKKDEQLRKLFRIELNTGRKKLEEIGLER